MEFESLKNELIENVKPHSPCASEYKRALSATNEEELLKVIYDNIGWCSETKTVSNEYFAKFDPTTLNGVSTLAIVKSLNAGGNLSNPFFSAMVRVRFALPPTL